MLEQNALLNKETSRSTSPEWTRLYAIGGISAMVLLLYSLATMLILILIGGQPESAREGFAMLQENKLTGLLRLDILAIAVMPLYYVIFLAIYGSLRSMREGLAAVATLLVFAGLTLFLATPSAFSWIALSDKYAAAMDEAQKAMLLASGEAIMASDMWHGSGAMMGGVLLQTGALLVCILMLGNRAFTRATAYVGIVTHGLDLLHIFAAFLLPMAGVALMAVAGPLYLFWFPLLSRDLFKLGRSKRDIRESRVENREA